MDSLYDIFELVVFLCHRDQIILHIETVDHTVRLCLEMKHRLQLISKRIIAGNAATRWQVVKVNQLILVWHQYLYDTLLNYLNLLDHISSFDYQTILDEHSCVQSHGYPTD